LSLFLQLVTDLRISFAEDYSITLMSLFGLTPVGSPQVPCFMEFMPLLSFLAVSIVRYPWERIQFERILTMRVNAGVMTGCIS
jgi:hypothetical protein